MKKERIVEILTNQIELLEAKQKEIHDALIMDKIHLEIELSKQILEITKELNELRKGAI